MAGNENRAHKNWVVIHTLRIDWHPSWKLCIFKMGHCQSMRRVWITTRVLCARFSFPAMNYANCNMCFQFEYFRKNRFSNVLFTSTWNRPVNWSISNWSEQNVGKPIFSKILKTRHLIQNFSNFSKISLLWTPGQHLLTISLLKTSHRKLIFWKVNP